VTFWDWLLVAAGILPPVILIGYMLYKIIKGSAEIG
jgi:hypothetical protein